MGFPENGNQSLRVTGKLRARFYFKIRQITSYDMIKEVKLKSK